MNARRTVEVENGPIALKASRLASASAAAHRAESPARARPSPCRPRASASSDSVNVHPDTALGRGGRSTPGSARRAARGRPPGRQRRADRRCCVRRSARPGPSAPAPDSPSAPTPGGSCPASPGLGCPALARPALRRGLGVVSRLNHCFGAARDAVIAALENIRCAWAFFPSGPPRWRASV